MSKGKFLPFSCLVSKVPAGRRWWSDEWPPRRNRLFQEVWLMMQSTLLSPKRVLSHSVGRLAGPAAQLAILSLGERWVEGVLCSWPLICLCCYWVWSVSCRAWVKFQCKLHLHLLFQLGVVILLAFLSLLTCWGCCSTQLSRWLASS